MKKTLTIAIPAYNEEKNIRPLINTLLHQESENFFLEKLLVYVDGCTDATAQIVQSLGIENNKVRLMGNRIRKGKVTRLNEIFADCQSDYLAVFDADIKLQNESVIDTMVKSMSGEDKTVLVVAHQIPVNDRTIVGKIINRAYKIWDEMRLSVPQQKHIQNLYGAASLFRGSFVKNFRIPTEITDERGYLYLSAVKGGGFTYCYPAVICYRAVNTLHDFWKLGDRAFSKNQDVLAKYFGKSVYDEYRLPFINRFKSILHNFFEEPVYTFLALGINLLTRVFPSHDAFYDQGMWEPSLSTKAPIINS